MREKDRVVAVLAARQHGLVSRVQAQRLGLSRRMIGVRLGSERWERVHEGVYRLAGYPVTWKSDLMAACLLYGPHAYASHRSAGALRRLTGIAPANQIELIVARSHARSRPSMKLYRTAGSLHAADTEVVDGIPATAPARTLFDLAGVLPADAVEVAVDDALVRGLVTGARLRWQLKKEARSGRKGIRVMRALLADRGIGAPIHESPLETRAARALRGSDIAGLVAQYEVWDGRSLVARVDFAIPELMIAIEGDSYRWHAGRARWEHDLARRNALTALGWHIVHLTSRDIEAGADHIVDTVRRVVAMRRRSMERHS